MRLSRAVSSVKVRLVGMDSYLRCQTYTGVQAVYGQVLYQGVLHDGVDVAKAQKVPLETVEDSSPFLLIPLILLKELVFENEPFGFAVEVTDWVFVVFRRLHFSANNFCDLSKQRFFVVGQLDFVMK